MKNLIRHILKEETQNIDSFIDVIESKYPEVSDFKDVLMSFIEESGCQKIEFANFKHPALGVALHNGVLINNVALSKPLPMLMFIILHEVAHQYQFKKYGADEMYRCYSGEVTIDEASEFMKNTEIVADKYAALKIRQLIKSGYIDSSFVPPQMYKNVSIGQISQMIEQFKNQFRMNNVTSPEEISSFLYNMIKKEF
jgi:hypothetical protein